MPGKKPTHEQGQMQLRLYDLRREAKLALDLEEQNSQHRPKRAFVERAFHSKGERHHHGFIPNLCAFLSEE